MMTKTSPTVRRRIRKKIATEHHDDLTVTWSRRVRLLPILFFLAYLSFTIILFKWGPWPWPVRNESRLYGYLILVHLFLLFGYLTGARKQPPSYLRMPKVQKILLLALFTNMLMLLPTIIAETSQGIPDIVAAVADPGSAYTTTREWRQESSLAVAVTYIRMALGPLLVTLFPLTIFYRQRLSKPLLYLAFFFVLVSPMIAIATGRNKGVFDFVLAAAWLAFASHLSGIGRVSLVRRSLTLGLVAVVFVFALWFFTRGYLTRPGSGTLYFSRIGINADPNNSFVRWLPGEAQIGGIALASYLTQGYYALNLSLQLPFVPTFGVGNSFFLLRNAVRLTGLDQLETMPYPMRVEAAYGWDPYGNWSTIYPWLASDVSFPGTLIVVFFIGRLFALTWLDTLHGRNPWAVIVFSQLLIMLFYFPANNQILQTGESLFAFFVMLVLWARSRRRHSSVGYSAAQTRPLPEQSAPTL